MDYEYTYEYILDMLTKHCRDSSCCGFCNHGECPLSSVTICGEASHEDWDRYFRRIQDTVKRHKSK